jgi:hypothetical protein
MLYCPAPVDRLSKAINFGPIILLGAFNIMKLLLLFIACLCWPMSAIADCHTSSNRKPYMGPLMQELQALRAPVMTHWEACNWERDWPGFHQLCEKFPDITFIWPHAGFGSAAQTEIVLSQHTNVMITLSKLENDQRSLSSEEKADQVGGAIVDECGSILS